MARRYNKTRVSCFECLSIREKHIKCNIRDSVELHKNTRLCFECLSIREEHKKNVTYGMASSVALSAVAQVSYLLLSDAIALVRKLRCSSHLHSNKR